FQFITADPNLTFDVNQPAKYEDFLASMIIHWKPQNVKNGGFIVQHASARIQLCENATGALHNFGDPTDFWEAWEVDNKGNVYRGYRTPGAKPIYATDLFDLPIPRIRSRGVGVEIGNARYIDGLKINWALGGGGLASGGLPSTKTMPLGWTDAL